MHRQHADLQVGTKGVGHVVLLEGDRSMNNNAPTSKVFYRPIEASIRWAGLLRFEHVILASISSPRDLPQSLDCPRWGELERKSVGEGKSVSVRVDLGGSRILKKKK